VVGACRLSRNRAAFLKKTTAPDHGKQINLVLDKNPHATIHVAPVGFVMDEHRGDQVTKQAIRRGTFASVTADEIVAKSPLAGQHLKLVDNNSK
jgi:hypothetical protein